MVAIIIIHYNYVIPMKHMATLNARAIKGIRDVGSHCFLSNSWLTVLIFTVFFPEGPDVVSPSFSAPRSISPS